MAERIPTERRSRSGSERIPNAILSALADHRDLGIHTELISDGVMDLVERGVVNGVAKELNRTKTVGTFALGTQPLYDFLHENTAFELWPVRYVNDPRVIAQETNFVSINATIAVDLIGQCASETVAGEYYSSSGGQADFARGAMYSTGGQGFVVLHSTAERRIDLEDRAQLAAGDVVTTLKNTVDKVVTEWGVAELRGRSIRERADALIAIAHPDHREPNVRRQAACPHLSPSSATATISPSTRPIVPNRSSEGLDIRRPLGVTAGVDPNPWPRSASPGAGPSPDASNSRATRSPSCPRRPRHEATARPEAGFLDFDPNHDQPVGQPMDDPPERHGVRDPAGVTPHGGGGTGTSAGSNTRIVPGSAPLCMASMTTAKATSVQASSSRAGSPSDCQTSDPAAEAADRPPPQLPSRRRRRAGRGSHPDHDAAGHARSTVRSRKCVAQEMHGS